jgi:glucan biosynthesis protein C
MGTHVQARPRARLFYLDNLRIYLTILVILHHATLAYGGSGSWKVRDPGVDDISPILLTYFTAVNQTYFMSAFFLLAGYFTPGALRRKGAGEFLRNRLIRLGIPILVYSTLVINLNQVLWGVWMRGRPFRWIFEYAPGHLWFLQALLLFAVVYVLYRMVMNRVPAKQRPPWYADRFPPDRALALTIALLAVLTFVVRIGYPVGRWVYGFQLGHFIHYVFSFFAGILAYRGDWLSRIGRHQAARWGLVGLVLLPLFFIVAILGGALEGDAGIASRSCSSRCSHFCCTSSVSACAGPVRCCVRWRRVSTRCTSFTRRCCLPFTCCSCRWASRPS